MSIKRPPVFDPLRFVEPAPSSNLREVKSREALIAELAYFKAEQRGFEPGHADRDWLQAESEIDSSLNKRRAQSPIEHSQNRRET